MIDRNAGLKIARENLSYRQEDQSLRYQKLLEAATDYTYTVIIEDGRPSRTVHSICSYAITGYTPAEYEETPFLWFEMIHEDDRGMISEQLNKLLRGVEIPPFEHRIIHKNGSIRWVRNTVVPHCDAEGRLVEYDALVSDITEAKRAAAKTAKINRDYRTLSMCNQAMIRATSEKELLEKLCHILTETGGYALAWVGYARHDVEKSVIVAAGAGSNTAYLQELRFSWADTSDDGQGPTGRAIRTGQTVLHDSSFIDSRFTPWQVRARDYGYLSSIALPLRAEQKIIGALNLYAGESKAFNRHEIGLLSELADDLSFGIMALRTKKKHAKAVKALAASSMRLQAIFETVQAGIVIIDKKSRRIVDANPAAKQLIGLPCTKLIGSKCYQSICPTDKEHCPVLDLGQHLVNSGQSLLQADGKKLPVLKSVVELELNGRPCLVESFLDISKRVEDEHERLKLQSHLRQAQKMEAIGTLAGGIAHDFNNLLQSILGYAGLLLYALPEKSEHHQFADAIKTAGVSAAALIKQILTFSRQREHEQNPLQLQYLIKEALKLLRATLPSTIAIEEQISMQCSTVLADSTEIHQIIMNLGTNAYHAMRENGGTLTVQLDEIEVDQALVSETPDLIPEARYVRLRVSDTGHGMDLETQQRIFEPYFTTKEKGEGTGLGLAIIHGITKSCQGAISVRSALGKGAAFTLFFPVLEQAIPLLEGGQNEENVLARINASVLFVDDNERNVILGESVLKQIGCSVMALTDSREALDAFGAMPEKFDLVITDQTMPHLTGLELAKKMLKIREDIPIIMLTGHSDLVDEQRAKAVGIAKFLMKPISMEEIAQAMEEILLPRKNRD
ncbi:MAG: PAS domain S-box protein [Desulfurivibrionaceae bacterium]